MLALVRPVAAQSLLITEFAAVNNGTIQDETGLTPAEARQIASLEARMPENVRGIVSPAFWVEASLHKASLRKGVKAPYGTYCLSFFLDLAPHGVGQTLRKLGLPLVATSTLNRYKHKTTTVYDFFHAASRAPRGSSAPPGRAG